MNSICEFLCDILPTSSAKVQAWASALTAGVAIAALSSWKKQKQYEIYIDASAALSKIFPKAFSVISLYTRVANSNLEDQEEFMKSFIDAQTESFKIIGDVNFYEFATRVELLGDHPSYVVLKNIYRTIKSELGNISSSIYQAHLSIENKAKPAETTKKLQNVTEAIQSASIKILMASGKFNSQNPKQS